MIFDIIADLFKDLGYTWKMGGKHLVPTADEIHRVVDQAARMLYAEPVHARFETEGLIIEKTLNGHDVYVRVGNYQ